MISKEIIQGIFLAYREHSGSLQVYEPCQCENKGLESDMEHGAADSFSDSGHLHVCEFIVIYNTINFWTGTKR